MKKMKYFSSPPIIPHTLDIKSNFDLPYFLTEKQRSKRSVSVAKEASQNNYRETRSVSNKHLEVMMVGDHLFLQRFGSENEAAGMLLLLAHMVRQRRDIFIF